MNAAAINFTKITVMREQKTQLQHTVPYMFKVKVNSGQENRITTSSDDVFYGKFSDFEIYNTILHFLLICT